MKKQLSHYLLLLILIIVVNFFLPRLMPGSPIRTLTGEDVGSLTAAEKQGILAAYDLDKPIGRQFVLYLRNLFTLQWGNSYSKRQPIWLLIRSRISWTLLLAGANLLISTLVGTFLGVFAAAHRQSRRGTAALMGSAIVSSLPPFWLAMILLSIFGVQLGWFPLYGAYDLWGKYTGLAKILDILRHLALPLLTLVLTSFMMFFTTARYGALQVLSEDYLKMASMRGISKGRIRRAYVLRNTWIPVFSMVMLDVGYLLSGSVLIETVFSYPGLGSLMQEAVRARDYPLIQYTFLVSSALTIAAMLAADLLQPLVDPRLGGGRRE